MPPEFCVEFDLNFQWIISLIDSQILIRVIDCVLIGRFYSEGFNYGKQYDLSPDLEQAFNSAQQESTTELLLLVATLGYAEGIEYLYKTGNLKASTGLESTIKELKNLCCQLQVQMKNLKILMQ